MCTTNTTPIRLPGLTLAPLSPPPGPPIEEGEPYASIEITGLPAASSVATREWSPLDTLSRALRSGGALRWERDTFILRDPSGGEVARGVRLDELALMLGAIQGKAPRSPWASVRLSQALMLQVAQVRNVGEGLSGFIRSAMRREIAHRLAEDADQDEVPYAA